MNVAELLYEKLTEMGRKIERPTEGFAKVPADRLRFYMTAPIQIRGFPERLSEPADPREVPQVNILANLISREITGTIAFIKPKEWPSGQGVEAEIFTHNGVQVQRLCGFDIRSYQLISRLGVTCYSAEESSTVDNHPPAG